MSNQYDDEEAPDRKEPPTIQASKATKDNTPIGTKTLLVGTVDDGVVEIGNCKTETSSSTKDLEGDSSIKYPEDSYSFMALNGPVKDKPQTLQRTLFFLFGLIPFVFQMVLLVLLAYSQTNELNGTIGENDNPDQDLFAKFIPANSTPIIRVAQVTSLAVYVIFPGSSITDIARGVQLFPYSSNNQESAVGYMRLSCILRLIQGVAAIVATLLLVLRSSTVVDIILNFTAVNFISELDDYAFTLAKNGEFSPCLRKEAERISEIDLLPCMFKSSESKWKCYRWVVLFVAVFLLAALSFVFGFQDSKNDWVTTLLRVQFQDSTGLNEYSGCFEIDNDSDSVKYSRRTYHSFGTGSLNTNFGYCREDRQWILFNGDASDPCLTEEDMLLARSSKTDTFDISSMFEESWVSASNTPLSLYFFGGNETIIRENCGLTLGDGVCDLAFNALGYDFDGGDCCAATCTKSNCGTGGLTSVFGNPDISGDGYENCKDPSMVPITIYLNNMTSSRDPQFTGWYEFWDADDPGEWDYSENRFIEWMKAEPVPTYLSLDCNGKNVMTVYLDNSMINQSQTVKVEDGATCSLVFRNIRPDVVEDDPIWYIGFTVFHDHAHSVNAAESVKILSSYSAKVDTVNFTRIPECYFEKLGDHLSSESIYTGNSSSIQAIDWLLKDPEPKQQCEDSNFSERYALVATDFATASAINRFIARDDQCRWPSIACNEGKLVSIQLVEKELQGDIPTELGLISDLQRLRLVENQLTSLPTEIGNLSSLQQLDLTENQLRSLPTEIGNLSSLQQLDLRYNQLKALPTEIGNLSSLQQLYLQQSQVWALPTEIGNLSSLQQLWLEVYQLSLLPTEIGNLSKLNRLWLNGNDDFSLSTEIGYQLSSSLPTEIGNLSSLQGLYLSWHYIKSLPTEIWNLSSLQQLGLKNNHLTSLSTDIGNLSSLQELNLGYNQLKALPPEIGNLSSLQQLYLRFNKLTSLPTEIGNLSSLQELNLYDNQLTSLPPEIGNLSGLQTLELGANQLVSLPTEIWNLSSLQQLDLADNQLESLPTEIGDLSSLQELDLRVNHLTSLPTEIGNLSSLWTLRYDPNVAIPEEVRYLCERIRCP